MENLIYLFIAIAIIWGGICLSNLVRACNAFHQDDRRVHKLDPDWPPPQPKIA